MNKYDKIGLYDNNTGEDLSEKITIGDLVDKHKQNERVKRGCVLKKFEHSPEELTLLELEDVFKLKNISIDKLAKFERYHQTSDLMEEILLDSGIKSNTFLQYKRLVCKLCGTTYTLQFKNNKEVSKDEHIIKLLEISKSSWGYIKKELISYNLIRVIQWEGKKIYKVNPCYIGKRKKLTINTYYAFRDDLIKFGIISGVQRVYWDKLLSDEYSIVLQ